MKSEESSRCEPPQVEAELEKYLASADKSGAACAGIFSVIRKLVAAGELDHAAIVIQRVIAPGLDYTSMLALTRLWQLCRGHRRPSAQTIRLAVLSSFTAAQLVDMIELFVFAGGVDVEIYQPDFGLFRQEIIDSESGLYRFGPGTIFVATTWRELTHWPAIGDDRERVRNLVDAEQAEWTSRWKIAHDRSGAQIIQNNFDRPLWQQLGNHEMRHPASHGQFINQVNQAFHAAAPPYVTIHDLDGLSASIGRRSWGDERFFHHAKLPCAPEHLVEYAHSVASILLAQLGLSKKCLVLDLDNTLWGGVIGDDGLAGIRLGQGDAEGEGFVVFQRYARKLRERGVILAVCSKNNEEIAREVFLKHPEMVLKLEDISCFTANWDDKATNLRAIAKNLNIGLNSLVFVDDNPAERAIVRQMLPQVAVPEVGIDPSDFIEALERHRYFQLVLLGKEDLQRTEYYLANIERQQVAASAHSIEDFLKSLKMAATVEPISSFSLERSTQLINKSNQFNLTTIRRSAAEVLAIANDPKWITRTVSLKDRFGDNGLISVILAKIDGGVLEIDTWLMSCRVLKRNVERLLLNQLCVLASSRGLSTIRGRYEPTARNELVKDHYCNLGFRRVAEDADGTSQYDLKVSTFKPFETFIQMRAAE